MFLNVIKFNISMLVLHQTARLDGNLEHRIPFHRRNQLTYRVEGRDEPCLLSCNKVHCSEDRTMFYSYRLGQEEETASEILILNDCY